MNKIIKSLFIPITLFLLRSLVSSGSQLSSQQQLDLLASLVEESSSKIGLMSYQLEHVKVRVETTLSQLEARILEIEKALGAQSALLSDLDQNQKSLNTVQVQLQEAHQTHQLGAQNQDKERQAILDKANTTLSWLASQKVQSGSVQWEQHSCVWVRFPQPFAEIPHVVIAPLNSPSQGGHVWVDQVEKTRFEACGKGNREGAYAITWLALPSLTTLPKALLAPSHSPGPLEASGEKTSVTPSEKTVIDTTSKEVLQKNDLVE